jgi:hypothetical protein
MEEWWNAGRRHARVSKRFLRGYGAVKALALDLGVETGVTLGVSHLRPLPADEDARW